MAYKGAIAKIPRKPLASERTVDMFSGRTKEEEAKEIARIVAQEDIKAQNKTREPITQELIDNELKHYLSRGDRPLEGWRLTRQGNTWHLERLRDNGTSYSGILLSAGDLPKLLKLFQEAVNGHS